MGYGQVKVINQTPYSATGAINYLSCNSDTYSCGANATGTGSSDRGVCLVTSISATVNGVEATPYNSSGTSFSSFFIQSDGSGGYKVTS